MNLTFPSIFGLYLELHP